MLNDATITIMVTMTNMTLRCTCSAPKNVVLSCRQSIITIGRPARLRPAGGSGRPGPIRDVNPDRGDGAGTVEIGLRLRQRHENDCGVVFVHADSRTPRLSDNL